MAALLLVLVSLGCEAGAEARVRRIYTLGRRPTEPNRGRIAAMAKDPDRDVRASAIVVLASIDVARASGVARAALADPDGIVRAAAVQVIGPEAPSDPELAKTLASLAGSDPAWQVRRWALVAISGIDDPDIQAAVAGALSDNVRHVRQTALMAAAARPGFLPLDRIADLASSDPDWENRLEAVKALGVSGDPTAYAPLDAALGDPNEFVRAEAVRARKALERAGVAPPPPPPPAAAAPPREAKPRSGV